MKSRRPRLLSLSVALNIDSSELIWSGEVSLLRRFLAPGNTLFLEQTRRAYTTCLASASDRPADVFSLEAVFLEMLVARDCPGLFKDLENILKSPFDGTLSYAKNIDTSSVD